MRCFDHQDVEAVAACKNCGCGLARMFIAAGAIFLVAGVIHYTTGKRYERE